MGMFDTIMIQLPCKKCKKLISDWQTKELGCNLSVFKKDSVIDSTKQLRWVGVISSCKSCSTAKKGLCKTCKQTYYTGETVYTRYRIFLDDDGRWNGNFIPNE